MILSKKSLELLDAIVGLNSNLNLPIAVAEQIIEIRTWVSWELEKLPKDAPAESAAQTKKNGR